MINKRKKTKRKTYRNPKSRLAKSKRTISRKSKSYKSNKSNKSNREHILINQLDNLITRDIKGTITNNTIVNSYILNKFIYKQNSSYCICQIINDMNKGKGNASVDKNFGNTKKPSICKCKDLRINNTQGRSLANIYKITCNNFVNIIKLFNIGRPYIRYYMETEKYIFLECDYFSLQSIVHEQINLHSLNDSIKLLSYGLCKNHNHNDNGKEFISYQLMELADEDTLDIFLTKLLTGMGMHDSNPKESLHARDLFINIVLQVFLTYGHLQTVLEFVHADSKMKNIVVSKCNVNKTKYHTYNIYGKKIKLSNLGYLVSIIDFGRSIISLKSSMQKKQYRLISPVYFTQHSTHLKRELVEKYADANIDLLDSKILKDILNYTINPCLVGINISNILDIYILIISLLSIDLIREYIVKNKLYYILPKLISADFLQKIIDKLSFTKIHGYADSFALFKEVCQENGNLIESKHADININISNLYKKIIDKNDTIIII